MRVAVFSTKPYDREFLTAANQKGGHELVFFDGHLNNQTCRLTEGFQAVCPFVNDEISRSVINCLHAHHVRMIAIRAAGFNNVDLQKAGEHGITVARVPSYSPDSIAEFTIGLMLALSRKIVRACNRTREGNFSLDGLLGFNLREKVLGVIGTGRIGAATARILLGFGCRVIATDQQKNAKLESDGVKYVSVEELLRSADIVTLHCPLLPETYHLINSETIDTMKDGVMIVNTSRGALIDTEATINGLKKGKIGGLAIDVYEEEAEFFFEDFSNRIILDDLLARILLFPNVLVTGHQAFFSREAMQAISEYTIENISAVERGETPPGLISWEMVRPR
ncbi:MAG: 2-hydroxyacid dehydrogenase [Thermoguttaceae bacterium]